MADYNDISSVEEYFDVYQDQIACVIVEPIAANMGVVPPAPGFLEGLRKATTDNGALHDLDLRPHRRLHFDQRRLPHVMRELETARLRLRYKSNNFK